MRRLQWILVLALIALVAVAVAVPAVNAVIGILVGNGVVIVIGGRAAREDLR